MRKLNLYFLLTVLCALFSACTDEIIPQGGSGSYASGRLELRLLIPEMTEVHTRSTEEGVIGSLHVVAYKTDGTCCVSRSIDIAQELTQESGSYKLTLNFEEEVSDVHLIANANATTNLPQVGTQGKLDEIFETTIGDKLLLWGHVDMASVKNGTATVSLLRNVAKASITVSESMKDFTITSWKITHTASAGSVAPTGYTVPATTPNCKADEAFSTTAQQPTSETDESGSIYFYETPSGKDTRMVIEATKGGETRYYTALFLKNSNDPTDPTEQTEEFSLLRNHHYVLTVVSVGNGYASEDDALKAPAGNIQVDIKDHNYLISDMISNGAYSLGVCDVVKVSAEEKDYGKGDLSITPIEEIAYFVTLWGTEVNDQMTQLNLTPTVKHQEGSEWLKMENSLMEMKYTSDTQNSTGKGYVIQFSCEANPTEEVRQGRIVVTFGELSLPIVIEQAAANLKAQRKTYINGLPDGDGTTDEREYIHWLLYDVQGARATDMGGVTRNNGLHLGVGDENEEYRHNYTYKVEKKEHDSKPHVIGSRCLYKVSTMTVNGQTLDCYEISASDPKDPTTWIEQFQVTNGEGHTITYDLYHTGIFQYETGDKQPENSSLKHIGWYYYEVMKATPASGNVSMLDRNLGASGIADAGALYRLKEGGVNDPVNEICPKGYTLPSVSFWETLEGTAVPRYEADGTSYQSWEIQANRIAEGDGADAIRFPCGGYCIGNELYNEAIGYYWSTTIVSGNQGFDASSPDYGYWYRFARISGNLGLSSVRYVGENNSDYRYMSARCVRMDENLPSNKTRLTIIDRRSEGTQKSKSLYIYISVKDAAGKTYYENKPWGETVRTASESDAGEKTFSYDMIDPDAIVESFGKELGRLQIHFRQGGLPAETQGFNSNDCENG